MEWSTNTAPWQGKVLKGVFLECNEVQNESFGLWIQPQLQRMWIKWPPSAWKGRRTFLESLKFCSSFSHSLGFRANTTLAYHNKKKCYVLTLTTMIFSDFSWNRANRAGIVVEWVKPLPTMPESHKSACCCFWSQWLHLSNFLLMDLGNWQRMAQVLGTLPLMWETQMQFQAVGFTWPCPGFQFSVFGE